MRLVLSIVQRFMVKENNSDDVFQVGIIGLMKGALGGCKGRNKTKGCRIRPAPKPSGSESPERLGGERPSERSARGRGLPTPSLV